MRRSMPAKIKKILENPSLPVGWMRASGTVDYQEIANRSLLDTVVVKGDLNSKQLDVQTRTFAPRSEISLPTTCSKMEMQRWPISAPVFSAAWSPARAR